jgi:hypothetical protein
MGRVLRWIGTVVVRVLQVFAGVLDAFGSGGVTPNRVPPPEPGPTRREEYRP